MDVDAVLTVYANAFQLDVETVSANLGRTGNRANAAVRMRLGRQLISALKPR